jgi:hypothetical protein
MNDGPTTPQAAAPDAAALPTAGELEQAVQRSLEAFLAKAKQAAVEAIEEVVRRYGSSLGDEVRQALRISVDEVIRTQVGRLVNELAPSGDTARRLADGLHQELRDFANTTLRDLFESRLPAYSRWAGRSVIDYFLAGVLFAVAAVLLFAGGVLALQAAGVRPFATYLVGGAVALALGFVLLRVRAREREAPPVIPGEPPKNTTGG